MFQLLFTYVKQHKWVYLLVAVTLILFDITMLVPTQVIQRLVDQFSHKTLTKESLVVEIGLMLGATVLNYLSAYIWHLKLFQSSVGFKFDLQDRAFHKLIQMRTPFYEKFRSGDMMTRFSTDVESLMDLLGYGLMVMIYSGGMIAFIVPAMLFISWEMTLVAMIPMLILMILVYFVGRYQEKSVDDNREAVAALNDQVLEAVEGIRVTRAYSKKASQNQIFRKKTRQLAREGDRIMFYQQLYIPLSSILVGVSIVLILLMGASEIQKGQISLGQILALQLYLFSLIEPFWMLSDLVLVYQTGKTAFEKVHELIETSDDMEEDGHLSLDRMKELVFTDYEFSYPNAERPSLSGISWRLEAGQTVGIVGKTGSGKTTLIRQFLRQYPLGDGSFTINRTPVAKYRRKSIESLIGYVPQEHVLFSKSVRENILLGKAEAREDEILQAIATAAFSKDLSRMSDGLDTMIGERGVTISGGQKQRISLARAFLRQPDLLILDDSLSAVDARTEREIIQNIQKDRSGKTNVIVTHRLSAVSQADWILVLHDGQIIEEGSPAQLLSQKGWYYEQYQRQQAQEGEEA